MLSGLLSKLLSKYPRLEFLYRAPAGKTIKQTFSFDDIYRPASLITIAGFVLSVWGAFKLNTPSGLALVVIGRFLDLVDGPVSRLTQPTRFGAVLDATADKFALLALLIAAFLFQSVPLLVLSYVFAHNILNGVLAVIAQKRGHEPETAISGKLSMFGENAALFAFILASYGYGVFIGLGWGLFIASIPFGIGATTVYALYALRSSHK